MIHTVCYSDPSLKMFVTPAAINSYPTQNYSRLSSEANEPAEPQGIALQPMNYNPIVVNEKAPQTVQVVQIPQPQMQLVQVVQPRLPPNSEPVSEFPPFRIPDQLLQNEGRWKDGLCDCGNNMFPSCFCATCCCSGMYLNAQMAQKTGFMTFRNTLIAYLFAWIFAVLLGIGFLPSLFALGFGIFLRLHIVKKYQITSPPCCGETCAALCCYTCSVAQMARHVYGYTKVLDGDADIDRADSYGANYGPGPMRV